MKTSLHGWAVKFWTEKLGYVSRRRKSVRAAAAACLAVGLATAWTAPAEATVVHLDVTPTESLYEAYVVYYYYRNVSGYLGDPISLGNLPGGQTTSFDHDFPDVPREDFADNHGYIIMALHADGDTMGFTTSFLSDWPVIEGKIYSDLFVHATEEDLVDRWPTFDRVFFAAQYTDMILVPYGTQATLVSFSDATVAGTAFAQFVPEPATWVLVVSAAGACAVPALRRAKPRRIHTDS